MKLFKTIETEMVRQNRIWLLHKWMKYKGHPFVWGVGICVGAYFAFNIIDYHAASVEISKDLYENVLNIDIAYSKLIPEISPTIKQAMKDDTITKGEYLVIRNIVSKYIDKEERKEFEEVKRRVSKILNE